MSRSKNRIAFSVGMFTDMAGPVTRVRIRANMGSCSSKNHDCSQQEHKTTMKNNKADSQHIRNAIECARVREPLTDFGTAN